MRFVRLLAIYLLFSGWTVVYARDDEGVKKTPAELMPITAANLRGHAALYHEGWFVVSSTEKSLRYAKQHAIVATGAAMVQTQHRLASHTGEFGAGLANAGRAGVDTTQQVFSKGTENTRKTLHNTQELAADLWDFGGDAMQEAWHTFLRGNLSLAQRTAEDRAALAALPGGYFKDLRDDFKNLHVLTHQVKEATATHIRGRWNDAFHEAARDFDQAYTQSGTRGNSLSAVGDMLAGYLKVIYSGLVKPAARSTVQGSEAAVKTTGELIFLPIASVFIVSGRAVESVGLSLYYTTSMGVSLVSPTVEGGLLAGLSMLSYGATPVTYAVGGSLGVVNQIAVTAGAPVAGAAKTAVKGGAATVEYAALVSADVATGTTKVALNQLQAGVALGYNALTALPTQLALGAANGVVFLAWDGPRLVVASAQGEVQWHDPQGQTRNVPVQTLPVGSVVDLQALGMAPGVEVKVISDDPQVVQDVLEKLPQDLRVGGKDAK